MTSRKTAAKEKRLLVTSRFLNYFFVLRQNKNSQKILNFQDFPAVLSKSTGIPKAKPHDNNREMQFCANENDQIRSPEFRFVLSISTFVYSGLIQTQRMDSLEISKKCFLILTN